MEPALFGLEVPGFIIKLWTGGATPLLAMPLNYGRVPGWVPPPDLGLV